MLRGRLRLLDTLFLRCLVVKVSPKGGKRILDLSGVTDEPAVIRELCVARQAAFTGCVVLNVSLTKLSPKGGARILDLSGVTNELGVFRQPVLGSLLRLLDTLFLICFLKRG